MIELNLISGCVFFHDIKGINFEIDSLGVAVGCHNDNTMKPTTIIMIIIKNNNMKYLLYKLWAFTNPDSD